MLAFAETVRAWLIPFIAAIAALLLLLLTALVVQRVLRNANARRERAIERRLEPFATRWATGGDPAALETLVSTTRESELDIVGRLLTAPMRAFTGEVVDRCAAALDRLGLLDRWMAALHDRRWWRRADAAHALGLARERRAVRRLIACLNDEHEEVRAAALDGLGRIGDAAVLPALIAKLGDPARHQQARVIDVLRRFGVRAAEDLVRYGREHPGSRVIVADALGQIGSGVAAASLVDWCDDPLPATRAASLRALGSIGIDDRSYAKACAALMDPSVDVRAMAARALGRSGRADAATELAGHLDDEWVAAAHAARALRQLGSPAKPHLEASAAGGGRGAELAKQMLWELEPRA